jgi:hypothetical protein
VESSPEKSRKRALPLAMLILALLLLSAFVMRDALFSRSTDPAPVDSEADSEPDVPLFFEILNAVQKLPISRTNLQPTQCGNELLPDNLNPQPEAGANIDNLPLSSFAVVDLKRVFAAHESDAASPETKADLLASIKGIVAVKARARGLKFVFDLSAQTFNGTPMFITSTNGLLDITDDVLKALSQ